MAKYVKCGKKAFGFSDPYSGFNIARGEVKQIISIREKKSGKIKSALAGGHLMLATEEEYKTFINKGVQAPDEGKDVVDFGEMTKDELVEYYKSHYQVTTDEVEAFGKMKKADMIEELKELENE